MAPAPDRPSQILHELECVLSSPEFANAGRVARFLRYAVELSLAGDRDGLKESVIGTAVFGRPAGYDPKIDPIVRTEARRMRVKLDEYLERAQPRVRITIPKGGYVAEFEFPAPAAHVPVVPEATAAPPVSRRRMGRIWIGATVLGAVALIATVMVIPARNRPSLPVLTTVTSFPNGQANPSLSPDGSELAFIWAGEENTQAKVFVVPVKGGEPRRVSKVPAGSAPELFPVWSPDGSRIAFTRRGSGLFLAEPLGGEERKLCDAYASAIDWSPDGRRIVFSSFPNGSSNVALFVADALTGSSRQIEKTSGGLFPVYSPDGSRLAFARCVPGNCDIWTMPAEGGDPIQLTDEKTPIFGVTWSPDGRSLVFSSRRLGPPTLWRVPANGTGSPEAIPAAGEDTRFPRFAPKTSGPPRLIFEQHILDSNVWRVFLAMGPDGPTGTAGAPRRLIASTKIDGSPQISPDGRRIVFVSTRSGFGELWTVDANGANPVAVTQMRSQGIGSPRWSPDSTRLVFDAVSSKGRALYVVDATGGAPRQWSPDGSAGRASWSHDGRWIYYSEQDKSGAPQIWKASSSDPNQRTQLTRDGGFEPYESADGQTLFYVHGQELWRMPATGGSHTMMDLGMKISHGWWALTDAGIYLADVISAPVGGVAPQTKGTRPVYFYSFKTGLRREIAKLPADVVGGTPDFCVSPDGRQLYYGAVDVAVSQIRMIEGSF